MARKSLKKILTYLQPFTRYEGIEIQEFEVPVAVHNKFPRFNDFKEILIGRLKKRPLSDRSTSGVSLFDRLQSLGALNAILSESVIEEIQSSMVMFEIDEQLRLLENRHLSSHNFSTEFHRTALRAIHGHILTFRKIAEKYEVGNEWLIEYLSACHKQMIREVRALFPLYPFGNRRLSNETTTQSADDLIPSIYNTLQNALRSSGVRRGRKELSLQLTSVFCECSAFFSGDFSADSVRNKIDD